MSNIQLHTQIQRISLKEVPSYVDNLGQNEFVVLDSENGFFLWDEYRRETNLGIFGNA